MPQKRNIVRKYKIKSNKLRERQKVDKKSSSNKKKNADLLKQINRIMEQTEIIYD